MNIFEYPVNTDKIIKNKKKHIKDLSLKKNLTEKKIAILGGTTTADLKSNLELNLLSIGIKPIFYESNYNQYFEEAIYSNKIELFNPDIIIIATSHHNLQLTESTSLPIETITKNIEKEFNKFKRIWEKLIKSTNSIIIQNNFDLPTTRTLGQLDSYAGGLSYAIHKLNIMFSEFANTTKQLHIHDYHYLTSFHGIKQWKDETFWYAYKYANNINMTPLYSNNLCNLIAAIYGKSKKCLILDLDNTLWGGRHRR
ncbi:hypothetical protein DID76_02410 [Candidatus Marinamargulisbacteria bacterium SCGC AG-414-C22]|nr:hypothetical protein DID76_02410 [Candidatus Marinamargulisbacteria bacterium SCGC AG-414-C22]